MQSHEAYLKRAIELSVKSRESGNTPFAALLVDKDGNIIMEQMNNEITEHKCTGHAETQLVERASHAYSKEFLWDCTLYTTAEPCAMCSGAIAFSHANSSGFWLTCSLSKLNFNQGFRAIGGSTALSGLATSIFTLILYFTGII